MLSPDSLSPDSKTALANYLHGAAINAKRWIRLLQHRMRPDDACGLG
jgi:hypothetical protein